MLLLVLAFGLLGDRAQAGCSEDHSLKTHIVKNASSPHLGF